MDADDLLVARGLAGEGNQALTVAALCARFGHSNATRGTKTRISDALGKARVETSIPLWKATWSDVIELRGPRSAPLTTNRFGIGTPSATWLLVASRYSTRGIAHELLHGETVDWSVPRDLRAGDLALLYERERPERKDGPKGRKEIVAILRALTDAEPRSHEPRPWFATFAGVPLFPRVDLARMRSEARLNTWPALRVSLQGANHRIDPRIWTVLLEMLNEKDSGAAADAQALALSEAAPPRSHSRATLPPEERDMGLPADWPFEQKLTNDVVRFIRNSGAAVPATAKDGFRATELTGEHTLDNRRRLDALLKTRRGHLVVVEFERYAQGAQGSGVDQVLGYRQMLADQGCRAAACVIAMDFVETEVVRAREGSVELLQARLDHGAVALRHVGGPIGLLTTALRERGALE